jgi:retron-type reverse transcriptase
MAIKFSNKRLIQLSLDLRQQKYKPKPLQKNILSIYGEVNRVRFLGVASPIDKIVLSTLFLLLSNCIEPFFTENSYGFRTGLGCHDALYAIKNTWDSPS